MAYNFPYVTNKFIAYEGDKIIKNLSLAVLMIDNYTEEEIIGNISVKIKEGDIKAVRNLTGYYIFNNLSPGSYNLLIESDFYFTQEKIINIPLPSPKNPVEEISLVHKPSYPFEANATLVRGLVSNVKPIIDADISVIGKTEKTKTNENGEFVLFFKGIGEGNITIEIKKYDDTKYINATIKEGNTVSLGIISFE